MANPGVRKCDQKIVAMDRFAFPRPFRLNRGDIPGRKGGKNHVSGHRSAVRDVTRNEYPCGIDGFGTVLDRICNDMPMSSRDKNYKPRVSEAIEGM